MARRLQEHGSRGILAYAVFIGVTFGLATSIVFLTRRADHQQQLVRGIICATVLCCIYVSTKIISHVQPCTTLQPQAAQQTCMLP